MVQRYGEELKRSIPEVDAFIGLDELDVAPAAATNTDFLSPAVSASTYLYDHTTPRKVSTPSWTAYVKISEGCDHQCAFCAIPSFRGRYRSRDVGSLVTEVERLATAGVREINLISQDSSHFGRDRREDDGLAALLVRLDAVESLRWIRPLYLYPNMVSDRLIDAFASLERVVKYLDIPLQHADPAVLSRMLRGGNAEQFLQLISRIRDRIPGVAVRSSLIVGFPGETGGEFAVLERFVEEAAFDHLGVFTYSHEEGTEAYHLADDIPEQVKNERRERIMTLQQEQVEKRNGKMVGRRVEVLVEGAHPETEHLLAGRISTQAPEVDGCVIINDGTAQPGSFVTVELTGTAGYDLVGRIDEPAG
jgi:ribosomal protein S12 methylthiotransferase